MVSREIRVGHLINCDKNRGRVVGGVVYSRRVHLHTHHCRTQSI
jgi:hypothetical protein